MAEALRWWFLALFSVWIAGFIMRTIQFRGRRGAIEKKIGPVPTPIGLVMPPVGLLILLTRTGEMSAGWAILRALGVALSLYTLVIMQWAGRTLGRSFVPGVAIFRDHVLVTSGPYRLIRHPVYSGILALWLGAAFGTMNWLLLALSPLVLAWAFWAARSEEALLRAKLGAAYDAYAAKTTARFIPNVW